MMAVKGLVVMCCVISAVLCSEKYTDKYDNINLKETLDNDRLLTGYFECIIGKGKCTPEGKELKEHIVEAMETGCEKCTDVQKEGVYTVLEHLINKKPEMWKALCEKYDPTGKWRKTYEDRAKEKGLNLSR